jgi:DNA repair ATPase RecN
MQSLAEAKEEGTKHILEQAIESGAISEQEAELIRHIDIDNEGVTAYAASVGQAKSSISVAHRNAIKKLEEFKRSDQEKHEKGNLAASVFELLDKGKSLTDVVKQTRTDPDLVQEIFFKWKKMKEIDINAPSVPKKIRELTSKLEVLNSYIELVDNSAANAGFEVNKLKERLDKSAGEGLYESRHVCKCGSTGLFAIHYKCTKCGVESWWGRWPGQ